MSPITTNGLTSNLQSRQQAGQCSGQKAAAIKEEGGLRRLNVKLIVIYLF